MAHTILLRPSNISCCRFTPWQEANLVESPFVLVFDVAGVPYAADIMNFVIITAVLSVANSGLYANSRMLWAMAKQGMASPAFTKLTKKVYH